MKFCDKIKEARLLKKLSIDDLVRLTQISKKSLISYEDGKVVPQKQNIRKLSVALNVSVTYLMDENESDPQKNMVADLFLSEAHDKFGTKGEREAKEVLGNVSTLFAGGELQEDAKDVFYQALMMAYMDSKESARERFTPKKFKKGNKKS